MDIIPAIDLIEGKCVRLTKGDYATSKVYNTDPLEVARMFVDHGIRRLHLVDLDGAKAGRIINHKVLERVASQTSLVVDFGGGLKSDDDLRIAFECGAQMVTGGSIAIKNKALFLRWLQTYGSEKIILGADVKDQKIAVSGWQENTDVDMWQFLQDYIQQGITKVICTDISRDGMLQGTATDLYVEMRQRFNNLYVVASGGVSNLADVQELADKGIPAVIIGKAIYEGRIDLKDLKPFLG